MSKLYYLRTMGEEVHWGILSRDFIRKARSFLSEVTLYTESAKHTVRGFLDTGMLGN